MRKALILVIVALAVVGSAVVAGAAPRLGGPPDIAIGQQGSWYEFRLNKPANTVPGDLLIAQIAYRTDSSYTLWLEYESGWVKMDQIEHPDYDHYVMATFYRRAGAAEPAQYRWWLEDPSNAGGTAWVGAVSRFTGANYAYDGSCSTGKGTVMTAPSVYAPADSLLLALYCKRYGSMAPPPGMSQLYQYYSQYPQLDIAAFSEVRSAPGSTGSRVTSDSNGTEWFAQLFYLSTMAPSAPVVVVHPTDQTVTYGQDAYLYANVNGVVAPFPAVQWQSSADEGLTWTDIPGANTIRWTLTRPPVAWNGYLIRATFDNGVGGPVSTNPARLSVNRKALTATAANKAKDYDGLPFPSGDYTVNYSGLVAGEDASVLTGSVSYGGDAISATLPGTYTIQPSGDLSADNYAISYANGTLTINKRPITVTADAKSKIYGGTDPEWTYQITSGSLLSGDEFSGEVNRAVGENAGLYNIQKGTLTLGDNYALTFVPAYFTIQPMPLTVTADAKTKAYGNADPALTYQITTGHLVGSDKLWGSLRRNAGEAIGDHEIWQLYMYCSPGGGNYAITYVPANLTIEPRPVTITGDPKSKTYGNADPALTYHITSGNLVAGGSFTGALAREAGEAAGTYQILQGTVALDSNYALTYVPADFTISPRPITIAADPKAKDYGEADPELTYQITAGTLVSPDTFAGDLSRVPGEAVGAYEIQQGTVTLGSNYAITYVPADLTISSRAVTITADPATKTYGEVDPPFTYQVTSESPIPPGAVSGELTRVAGESVGSYQIQQGSLAVDPSYAVIFVPARLNITPRPLTIAARPQTKIYGDADPALTYEITSGSLAFEDGLAGELGRVSGENVGTYGILQGSLTLGGNYSLSYVPADLTVLPRPVTVTADAQSKGYGTPDPALTYQVTAGGLAFGDGFTGELTREAGETLGSYEILQGTLALGGNYLMTYNSNWLTVEAKSITVTADSLTKTYGHDDPPFTWQITSGNLLPGDQLTCELTREAGEDVGSYAIELDAVRLSDGYTVSFVPGQLGISPRPVKVTADAKAKVYGETDPELTYQITAGSLAFSDAFTGALAREAGEDVGSYRILQGTLALGDNYELGYVAADLTIAVRPITVTADAQSKLYGADDPALTFDVTSGSLVSGDDFTGALTRKPGEDPGIYPILAGSLALPDNYELHYEGASLSIRYGLDTLLAPYGTPAQNFKAGRVLPLKWTYTDCAGDVVASGSADPTLRIYSLAGSEESLIATVRPAKDGLKYVNSEQMWMYNWSTKGLQAGAYRIVITSGKTGQTQSFELELTE